VSARLLDGATFMRELASQEPAVVSYGSKGGTSCRLEMFEPLFQPWDLPSDGSIASPTRSALQVWGLSASGKTWDLRKYLRTVGISDAWLDCASFTAIEDFHAKIAAALRHGTFGEMRPAVSGDLHLERPLPICQRLHPIVDAVRGTPLERPNGRSSPCATRRPIFSESRFLFPLKVLVVLDQAEALARLGHCESDVLIALTKVLTQDSVLAVLVISQSPLSRLGLSPAKESPLLGFLPCTKAQVKEALLAALAFGLGNCPCLDGSLTSLCDLIMKFAAPHLRYHLGHLVSIGNQLLHEGAYHGGAPGVVRLRIQRAVVRRLSLGDDDQVLDYGKFFPKTQVDARGLANTAVMCLMTEAEKKLSFHVCVWMCVTWCAYAWALDWAWVRLFVCTVHVCVCV
jgi:hypothetical protein